MVQWLEHWTVKIYDRCTILAPDFPFRVALPVHLAENGYRDLPWKLNAAERIAGVPLGRRRLTFIRS